MRIEIDVPYKDHANLRELYNRLLDKNAKLTEENIDLHNAIREREELVTELVFRLKSKYNPKLKPGIKRYLQERGL
jgi:hypothetical protein